MKSALEKIVYFEARSEQLQSDLASARAEIDQRKRELITAGTRELELRRQVAELEVAVQRSHRDREELGRMNDALKSERTVLLGKLIESSRIHASGDTDVEPTFDLASFISELRSEVINAKNQGQGGGPSPAAHRATMASAAAAATASIDPATSLPALSLVPSVGMVSPTPVSAMTEIAQHAERLMKEGRLRVSEEELVALAPRHASRTEETLFGFSVRELSAPDPSSRIRAAERLRALGEKAAAPVLAAALHGEREPAVLVVLLSTFSALAHKEGAAVVLPLLDSPAPEVRMSALKALMALDPTQAGPHVAAAAQDPDPSVRRRASLLGLGLEGDQAYRLEQKGAQDLDPDVRRLAALALGAAGGERARAQLLEALKDGDVRVRRAASQSLSRILGEDLSAVVDMEEAPRRREIRRLATLPVKPFQMAEGFAAASAASNAKLHPVAAGPGPAELRMPEPELEPAPPPSPLVAPAPPGPNHEVLCQSLVSEMRSAIRGRSLADLIQAVRRPSVAVEDACALLVARGQVVRRGLKYFVA